MAKKSCKKGYYYCNTDKKCKKVPKGWHVMPSTGYLMRDSEHKEEEKNGNGDGTNGNGGSNGGSDGGGVSESKDHEVAMAQSQLKKSEENIRKLRKALGKKEKDLPAWMQAKITDTAHDTDAAAGYVDKMDEEVISEKRDGKSAKDKGYSLRDWFKGGGWVQAGGKYDGKPCAKQPGQKTKPFCRDADDRANMSKKERSRRAAKKRKEDPNPNRKGKAKMVTASYSNWRTDLEQLDEFMGLFGPKTVTPKDSPTGTKSVKVGKKYPARLNSRPVDVTYDKQGNKTVTPMPRGRAGLMQYKYGSTWGMPQYNSYEPEGEVVEGYDDGDVIRPTDRIRMKDGKLRTLKDIDAKLKDNKPVQKNSYEPEGDMVDEGKKDACYHKVKSRYSVWPSAYASGALVKCRKVGAKNWGNKTKKESYEFSNWRDDFQATEYESVDIIKAEPLQSSQSSIDEKAQKCWKGYEKKGTKKMFGKTYNNCVKKEEVEIQEAIPGYEKRDAAIKAAAKLKGKPKADALSAAAKIPVKLANQFSDWRAELVIEEDWQKSNRKDGVDGMSQKSVNAYKRENPGSKLQTAVTEKKPTGKRAKRRKSFCARSKGQKDMHNIDCTKTPDKKICKARKRWRC